MKRSGGFSLSGIFFGLLISIGGSMLSGAIVGAVLGYNFAKEGYPSHRIQDLVIQEMQREDLVILLLLASGLWLLMGSFIAANTAGSSAVMAFIHAGVVGMVNIILNLPTFWESLGIPFPENVANQYIWIGVVVALPLALIGAVLSVLTVEKSSSNRSVMPKTFRA